MTTFRELRVIAQKFTMKHGAKRIIIRKITGIKTIDVTKMLGNFFEILFEAKFLRKVLKSLEFRQNSFALLLHNTVQRSLLIAETAHSYSHHFEGSLSSLWGFRLTL